jgi:hypothetical protein
MSTATPAVPSPIAKIAGLSILKGLMLYGATLTFAGLYAYFMVKIFGAKPDAPAVQFDSTLVSAAAALAGVLGSAFALEIGTTTDEGDTNKELGRAMEQRTAADTRTSKLALFVRRALSIEPSSVRTASWPKSIGIWTYALVASAVAVTYVLNQNQTPDTIKALAVAFAGYVMALVTNAYKRP